MKYLLTLDVGTTAVKAGLFSEELEPIAFAIEEYSLLTPKTNFIELDPDTYWHKTKAAIDAVLSNSTIDPSDIISITCTTQGETLIPVGIDGKHLSNAIVWLDGRAKKEANTIAAEFDRLLVYAITGLPEINGYCPIAKILWIKNNTPSVYKAAEKILLLEDYLILRLCGKFATNPSLLCSTGYFNINTDTLWDEMLTFCGISSEKFPEVFPSGKVVSVIDPSVAKELGLSPHTMITTGAMDQVASAIGAGNTTIGAVTETTGTAQVVAATCEKAAPSEWSPVTVYRHAVEDKFLKIVINQTAGIAYKWFRNEFCIDLVDSGEDAFMLMGDLAGKEPILSRGLTFFPHFTGMQFPQSDESLRGVFFGVGLDTNRGCFIRSIMEGVGYMLRESMEEMKLNPENIVSLGGGVKSEIWSQIKADICGINITTLENSESTSLGAAIMGCMAMGIYRDYQIAAAHITVSKVFRPGDQNHRKYDRAYFEYREMYQAFSPLFQKRKTTRREK